MAWIILYILTCYFVGTLISCFTKFYDGKLKSKWGKVVLVLSSPMWMTGLFFVMIGMVFFIPVIILEYMMHCKETPVETDHWGNQVFSVPDVDKCTVSAATAEHMYATSSHSNKLKQSGNNI